MSQTATYHTTVNWTGKHHGRLVMGNGPELDFSAPPEAHGLAGVFTPQDAFVAAANTCIMLMFIWAVERFKLNLISLNAVRCKRPKKTAWWPIPSSGRSASSLKSKLR